MRLKDLADRFKSKNTEAPAANQADAPKTEETAAPGADISVVIPFNNVEEYIGECLDSLFAQKGMSLDVILINDGSTDGSAEIVDRYMKEHPQMRVFEIPQNGPGYARNYGVRHARGEYIAFLDADDLLVPGIYRRMLRAARNNDADLCICNAVRFNSEKRWSSGLHNKTFKDYKMVTHITETPGLVYDTCAWNKLIRRDFYVKKGISFPEHVVYEDIIFNIDLHIKCNKVVMIAETGYLWRVRDNKNNPSISQSFSTERNVRDRFLAAGMLAEKLLSEDLPQQLKRTIRYRLLETDLRIILDSAGKVPEEQAAATFKEVCDFIDKYIDGDVMRSLSVLDLQRYEYAARGDVEGYKRLLAYSERSYETAPVEEKDGKLIAKLPNDLFTTDKRDLFDEFSRMPRRTYVDSVALTESGELEIRAHIYIRRYNMGSDADRQIEVFLINEERNRSIEMPSELIETPFMTANYGTEHDEATGTDSSYDYDGTGFMFRVGEEFLGGLKRAKRARFSVIVRYKDRLFEGVQIIKGTQRDTRRKCKTYIIENETHEARIRFGKMDELFIDIKKKDTAE